MTRRSYSTEEIIEKFESIHHKRYDYSKVNYKKMHGLVEIICPKHGSFFQAPHTHLKGEGCPKCAIEKRRKKRRKTFEDFKIEANIIHQGKYEYLEETYVDYQKPMTAICPKHGEFKITPTYHINSKNGCPKCFNEKRKYMNKLSEDDVLLKFNELHPNNNYDYSRVRYVNNRIPVEIICPKHGPFFQQPKIHFLGCGCPKCAVENNSKVEEELYQFVASIYKGNIIRNDRKVIKPKELDIYIPDLELAIEFDGLIFHSNYYKKKKNYHINKTLACLEKGIRLIHVFEDEWLFQNKKTKKILKDIIQKTEDKPQIISEDGSCLIDMRYGYGEEWLLKNGFELVEVIPPKKYYIHSQRRIEKPIDGKKLYHIFDCGWKLYKKKSAP